MYTYVNNNTYNTNNNYIYILILLYIQYIYIYALLHMIWSFPHRGHRAGHRASTGKCSCQPSGKYTLPSTSWGPFPPRLKATSFRTKKSVIGGWPTLKNDEVRQIGSSSQLLGKIVKPCSKPPTRSPHARLRMTWVQIIAWLLLVVACPKHG